VFQISDLTNTKEGVFLQTQKIGTHDKISIVVTTHRTDSLYTQACLSSIERWKNTHHELIVVAHDASELLRAYLEYCVKKRVVDKLLLAVSQHGHTRSFNLGCLHASGNTIFNISNDILVGPSIVDDCAQNLINNPRIGIIGWHWIGNGARWEERRLVGYQLRTPDPTMDANEVENIRSAPWFTGRTFAALSGAKVLHLCNGSFFGIRTDVLKKVGGGFAPQYPHCWADDFMCYAVLEQGYDVIGFDDRFKSPAFFREFQYDNMEVSDRRRNEDRIVLDDPALDIADMIGGGMSRGERILLYLLAGGLRRNPVIISLGVWRGASAVVLLRALRGRPARFVFIDGFDLPGVSQLSGQPPVAMEEFMGAVQPYVQPQHDVDVVRANTLDLTRLPYSDFVFVDCGHTERCVKNDARLAHDAIACEGIAVFHDYGSEIWPAVKPSVDRVFGNVGVYQTMAVYRPGTPTLLSYDW
jgi:GT2 family glycosyltransferase